MKIKQEHYQQLKSGMSKTFNMLIKNNNEGNFQNINSINDYIAYYETNNIGIIPKDRACHDILRISTINNMTSTQYICGVLYEYLNDTHINTALNKIMSEII